MEVGSICDVTDGGSRCQFAVTARVDVVTNQQSHSSRGEEQQRDTRNYDKGEPQDRE
jgi:hypothetical protein